MDTPDAQDVQSEGPRRKKQKLTGIKWKNHAAVAEPDRNKNEDFHRGYKDRSPVKHSKDRERSPVNDDAPRRRERSPPRWRDEDDRRSHDRYRDRDNYRPRADRDDRDYDHRDSRRDDRRERDRPTRPRLEDDSSQVSAATKPVNSELSQSVADKFGLPSDKSKSKDKQKKTPRVTAPSEPMIIVNINDRLGTKASIPCLASDSVKAFKAIVAAHIGRQPHEIMLKRQGERPFKDQLTLEDYGVSSGVQLDLELDTGS